MLPLHPSKEAFDNPSPFVAAQAATILRFLLHPIRFVRGNHFDALFSKLLIQWIAVVSAIADQIIRFRFNHVEIKTQLHERDFVMIRRVRTYREPQTVAIHNRHDFHAFSALRLANFLSTTLGRGKRRVDIALSFIDRAFITQLIGKIREHLARTLRSDTIAENADARFCNSDKTAEHVPLRTGVEYPQYTVEHFARRNRLAARAIVGKILLQTMLPDPFPVHIAQALYA